MARPVPLASEPMEQFEDVGDLTGERLAGRENASAPVEVLEVPGRIARRELADPIFVIGMLLEGSIEAGAHEWLSVARAVAISSKTGR